MSVRTSPHLDSDTDPVTGEPRLAHLVAPRDGVPGHGRVLEARIHGLPVQAMCGAVLVPSHDPRRCRTCPRCLELFRASTGAEDGWQDA